MAVLDVLGKMQYANSENAFHFSTTLGHGVSRANSVDPASNMIVDSNKCQAAGLICDEFVNLHAFDDVTSQIGTIIAKALPSINTHNLGKILEIFGI
jgi:hypothetical protein